MDSLVQYGWTQEFADNWQQMAEPGLIPARVVADFGTSLKIVTPEPITATLSGKLAHYTERALTPKVGDWVAARMSADRTAVIEAVVPRRSEIARKVAGKRVVKQIIAANIDIAYVVLSLDNDFSVERLQRFLYQLSIDAITPVIVLNKADKAPDTSPYLQSLQDLHLPIIIATAAEGSGADEIMAAIEPAKTAILLGSSGVGKSTLTNLLLGREVQATKAVRASDDTGQHTTVHRELFVLPNGGLLIDTPGVREIQLWGTDDDLNDDFEDVAQLISHCRYATCRHTTEPGCAVQAALKSGELSASRYADYVKMKTELDKLQAKNSEKTRQSNKVSRKAKHRQSQDMLDDTW